MGIFNSNIWFWNKKVKNKKLLDLFSKCSQKELILLIEKNPDLAKSIVSDYPRLSYQTCSSVYYNVLMTAIKYADTQEVKNLLNKISYKDVTDNFLLMNLNKIYEMKPELKTEILNLLDNPNCFNSSHGIYDYSLTIGYIYDISAQIINSDRELYGKEAYKNIQNILELIDKHIEDRQDTSDLCALFNVLDQIKKDFPQLNEQITRMIYKGLSNNNNDSRSIGIAKRSLSKNQEIPSFIYLVQRKDDLRDGYYGLNIVREMNTNKINFFNLGGSGTLDKMNINGYLTDLHDLIKNFNLEDTVDIYGAVYYFGKNNDSQKSRDLLINEYLHPLNNFSIKKILQNPEYSTSIDTENFNPTYIQEIFDKCIKDRISRDGKKINYRQAAYNISRLPFITHCHGTFVAFKLEIMMQDEMKRLKYTEEERNIIQKNMLILAFNPYCPLGVSKSTMISFSSAKDRRINYNNNFYNAIQKLDSENQLLPICYFPNRMGNLFLARTYNSDDEHNTLEFEENTDYTSAANQFIRYQRNIIYNWCMRVQNRDISCPKIEDLILEKGDQKEKKNFSKICRDSENFYPKLIALSRELEKEKHSMQASANGYSNI